MKLAQSVAAGNATAVKQLGVEFSQLSTAQIVNVAVTNNLNAKLFAEALGHAGVEEELRKAIIAEYEAAQAKAVHAAATKKLDLSAEGLRKTWEGLKGAAAGLGETILAHPFLAAVAAATLATIAITKFTEAQEASKRKLEELKESYSSLDGEAQSLASELKTNNERMQELQNLEAPTLADADELRKLKEVNAELLTQLQIKNELKATQSQQIADTFADAMGSEVNGKQYVAFTSTFTTNAALEEQAQQRIIAARQVIADKGKEISEEELAQQKKIIEENRNFLAERIAVYEKMAEGVEYGQSAEADAMLDYLNDLRIGWLAVSDSATSADTAIKAVLSADEYQSGTQQLQNLLKASKSISHFSGLLKNAYNAAGEDSSLVQLINKLKELGYFSWDNIAGLAETLGGLQDSSASATTSLDDLSSQVEKLSTKYNLLKDAKEEFNKAGGIGIDTLKQLGEKFPELQNSIDMYIAGMISGTELIKRFSDAYTKDEKAYQQSVYAKMSASEDFFNQHSDALKTLIDGLAEGYGVDLGNYKTVEEAKLNFSKLILQKLANAWGMFYGLTADNIDEAARKSGSLLGQIATRYGTDSQQYKDQKAEAEKLTEAAKVAAQYREFAAKLDAFVADNTNTVDPKKYYKQNNSSSSSKKSESTTEKLKKQYKALVDLQTNITRADDRLEKKAEDTTEEQIALWLKLRKAAVAELAKIKDHTSEAYRYVEDILKDANSHLDDLYNQQLDALDDLIDKTKDMIKQEVEDQCDALDKQIDKYNEIIDLKKKLLEDSQKEADYEDEVAEKVKAISDLQTRIAQLQLEINANPNDSRAAQAEQRKLQEELAKLQKELQDAQDEHYRDSLDARLDEEAEAFEKQKEDEIEKLKETIDSEAKLYEKAIERINDQWGDLYRQLLEYNRKYGTGIDSDITKAWEVAKDAVDKYGGSIEDVIAKIKSMQGGIQSATANGSYNQVNGDGTGFEGAGSGGNAGNSSGSTSGNGKAYQRAVQKFGAPPTGKPILKVGSTGKQVQWLQYYLDQVVNNGSGALPADGTFYTRTEKALKAFQSMASAKADGKFGPETASKLKKYHTGGVVGRDLGLKEREQLAILKDEEWVATGKQFRNVKGLLDAFAQIKKSLPRIQPLPVRPTPAIAGAGGNVFETNVDVRIEHHGDFDDKAAAKFADLVANKATKKLNDVMTRQGVRK